MEHTGINIQGNIISSELFNQIRNEQLKFQQAKDFGFEGSTRLKEEIGLAWADSKSLWSVFKSKIGRLKENETGAGETRTLWMDPLLSLLGYQLERATAEEISGKSYAINRRDSKLDGFPVFIAGYYESLDRKPTGETLRISPHALVQEYLNATDHLFALVTNGKQLRLLRDVSRLARLTYLEFDLEKIMEEDRFSDFTILFRLLHATRMPKNQESIAESIIEFYHQESLASGQRIRDNLSNAVKEAIRMLANGFTKNPINRDFREAIIHGKVDPNEFFQTQLRLIYRLLFLLVIEERNLVYPESKDTDKRKLRDIYTKYYSIDRLRKLAARLYLPDMARFHDLWLSLLGTFSLFEEKKYGEELGIMPLGGDLFNLSAFRNPAYDLHHLVIDNNTLLLVLKKLCWFETENRVLSSVNYGDLNVEEFGSVYEGLLELKAGWNVYIDEPEFVLEKGFERSSSGSHYTPEELVMPLIKHSLDYILEDRKKIIDKEIFRNKWKSDTNKLHREDLVKTHLLNLKVCDVACGSGHILLSAARRIADVCATIIEEEEQPNPLAVRKAKKEVIVNCIYGVDKNPLAVELCKVAMWLESYNPGEPLNFLDHHIKCGDAIVGLAHKSELDNGIANEAYKTLPEDEKNIAALLLKKNRADRAQRETSGMVLSTGFNEDLQTMVQEGLAEYNTFIHLPERTPEELERKQKAYRKFIEHKGPSFLKLLANIQVAQFFLPKTNENKDLFVTDGEFRQMYNGYKMPKGDIIGKVTALADEKKFFHWFVEFPDVFGENGNANNIGFDCILGNPPFLGNKKLTGTFGDSFLEVLKFQFAPIGSVDLVTYFFRRIFTIIKQGGFQSLISTNTIAQGNAREDGLEIIVKNGGIINHAVKSMKWPGQAAVEVALVTITKQIWEKEFILSGVQVKTITPYLDDAESSSSPYTLKCNFGKSFVGSFVLGKGFVLDPNEAKSLIANNPKNKDVLFPYLNGDDLNNEPDQKPSRWVINFFNWSEEKAKEYVECYRIIENRVKPDRQRWATDHNKVEIVGEFALRKPLPQKWWIYADKRPALYESIKDLSKVIVVAKTTKYGSYEFVSSDIVFTQDLTVFTFSDFMHYSVLCSSLMNEWVWKNSATMRNIGIRLNPSDCFENFPFLQDIDLNKKVNLDTIGETFYKNRHNIMLKMLLGLTKTYNAFHSKDIKVGITTETLQGLDHKAIEKQYGKEVWNLWNHLHKTTGTCTIEEAISGIIKLRELHVEMDEAVLEAYGWGFGSAQPISLKHDFYEVDYLPENDRIRFTIHPDARKEILKRLLELNHKIHEEEVREGLWEKKGGKEKKYKAGKAKAYGVEEEEVGYGGLFDQLKEE